MKFLIDMNLPYDWDSFLQSAGWEATHCCQADPRIVKDQDLLLWAKENSWVFFTHDLSLGTLLSLAGESGPSVFQIISTDLMTEKIGPTVVRTIQGFAEELKRGALVLADMESAKARVVRIPVTP